MIVFRMATAGYQWPIKPFTDQHSVSATFCENRPSSDGTVLIDHFHNAIDIPLTSGGNVYAIESGNVESLTREGYSAWIRVGRYNYLHVTPLAELDVNDYVQKGQLVGHTNYANHVHLIDGYYPNYINPLRSDGITPFEDPYMPTVASVKFYIDGTKTAFPGSKISGKVDMVVRLYDKTDNGTYGSNNGIYTAGYQVYDSSGTETQSARFTPYKFDVRPSNSYVRNVFFDGSDLSTYFYILTNQVEQNNYLNTATYPPGKYKIKIYTEDTRGNRTEFWKTVEMAEEDQSAPDMPQIKLFNGQADGSFQLYWKQNSATDIAGYAFYYSLNGISFTEQNAVSLAIGAQDTSYSGNGFNYTYPFYAKLRVYDNAARMNYSGFSNTYVNKPGADGSRFLIVDGFSRTNGYWKSNRHDFVVRYAEYLLEQGESFISCSVEALEQDLVDLRDYPNVLYFKGDESGLSTKERNALAAYLENGGNLFICGSEIVSGLTESGQSSFATDYLKATLLSDSSVSLIISDTSNTSTGELSLPYNVAPACDVLAGSGGAQPFFFYQDGSTAGISFYNTFGNSEQPAKLIFAGFPFELLEKNSGTLELFNTVSGYFNAADISLSERPEASAKLSAFPNPFTESVTIRYTIDSDNDKPVHVVLDIFDLLGRRIKILVDEEKSADSDEVIWEPSAALSSGLYICRLRYGRVNRSIKLILLK